MSKVINLDRHTRLIRELQRSKPLFVVQSSIGEMLMTLEAMAALRFYMDRADRQSMQALEIEPEAAARIYSFVWTVEDVEVVFGTRAPEPA